MTYRAKFVVFCGLSHGLKIFQKFFKKEAFSGTKPKLFSLYARKGRKPPKSPKERE